LTSKSSLPALGVSLAVNFSSSSSLITVEAAERRRGSLEIIRTRLREDFHVRFVFEENGHGEGVFLLQPPDPEELEHYRQKARSATAKDESEGADSQGDKGQMAP
jgi:hypothetical protein